MGNANIMMLIATTVDNYPQIISNIVSLCIFVIGQRTEK